MATILLNVAHHGDSQPIAADWDGDGLLDLIVAWGDGSVVWYRNVGTKTEPKLAKGITLVKAAPRPNYDDNAPPTNDNKPGVRAKVCVVDWNGEGHLDLLVGDFGGIYGEKPKMSEQDKKIEQEAKRKIQELQQKMQPFYDESARIRGMAGNLSGRRRSAFADLLSTHGLRVLSSLRRLSGWNAIKIELPAGKTKTQSEGSWGGSREEN